jgi:hypothetical protein
MVVRALNNLAFHSFDKAPILAWARPGKIFYDDGHSIHPPLPGRAILSGSARFQEREAPKRGGETNGKQKDNRHGLTRRRDSHFDPVAGSQFHWPRKPIRFWAASDSRRHRGSNRGCRWAVPDTQEIVSWPSPSPRDGGSGWPESVLRARPIGRALLWPTAIMGCSPRPLAPGRPMACFLTNAHRRHPPIAAISVPCKQIDPWHGQWWGTFACFGTHPNLPPFPQSSCATSLAHGFFSSFPDKSSVEDRAIDQ